MGLAAESIRLLPLLRRWRDGRWEEKRRVSGSGVEIAGHPPLFLSFLLDRTRRLPLPLPLPSPVAVCFVYV